MESLDQSKEKELKDKCASNRLRLATTRVKDAERERIWAIAVIDGVETRAQKRQHSTERFLFNSA